METQTLFQRLGGAAGIAALVDAIVVAHAENPAVRVRFLPVIADKARLEVIKQHTCQFLAQGTGGPASYAGRSMAETHRGMNINAAEYMAVIDDILAVLRAKGIDEQSQKDVLAIAWSLKDDILHH